MIIINISAGLGNQMFMYAFGRAMSLKHKKALILDISNLENDNLRSYGLQHLFLPKEVKLLSEDQLLEKRCKIKKKVMNIYAKLLGYSYENINDVLKLNKLGYFYYSGRKYIPEIRLSNARICYFYGMFQCEKYFHEYKEVICKELKVSECVNDFCKNIVQEMEQENSVCVHIRRGDYLKSKIHNVCGDNYYRDAIEKMESIVENPRFYIFTDDPEWAKQHYPSEKYRIVSSSNTDYEDLYCMYHCKHFIISNSTFSWWAQYLGEAEDKVVIAPERWYNNMDKTEILKRLVR